MRTWTPSLRGRLVWLSLASLWLTALASAADRQTGLRWEGRIRAEVAGRLSAPQALTKAKTIGELAGQYAWSEHVRLRLASRAFYDAVYALTDTFPDAVARDQDAEVALRQAQLDLSFGNFDAHLGLQQIVWGEAVGTFIADVVNPKDFREFVLPEFRDIRRPLWAVDLTYHLAKGLVIEGVWTPDLRFNTLPRPGAAFAVFRPPPPPGVTVVTAPTRTPALTLGHSQGGLRLSWLTGGWDLALFYYDAFDAFPTNVRHTTPSRITITPQHTRVHILGATLGKALEPFVLRGEIVATLDKFLQTSDLGDRDGVERRHVVDYLLGVDYTLFDQVIVGVQFLQHLVPGGTAQLRDEQQRRGVVNSAMSVRLETSLFEQTLIPQVLYVVNFERGDYRLSPRAVYHLTPAVTLTLGAHLFSGPHDTLYGQFRAHDMVYTEVSAKF